MPDGSLIAAVNKAGNQIINSTGLINSIEDDMIQVNRTTAAVMGEWDMRALLDVGRNEVINSTGDWFHMNGIWYSAADDCFIISGRHQGVVKVTRNNRLKWILAGRDGWGNAGFDGTGPDPTPFLLKAVDANGNLYDPIIQSGFAADPDFDWPWGQHNPMLLPNGHLFVFDNGFRRWFSDVSDFFSRGVEYVIDENALTVRQLWQYGKERGIELYSTIISDVDDLPLTHNRLMNPGIVQLPAGSYAKVIEVTYPGKQVVFEATARFKNLLSLGTANGGFDLVYRSRRISLYP
jgi:arylsulfate sulfotransferase